AVFDRLGRGKSQSGGPAAICAASGAGSDLAGTGGLGAGPEGVVTRGVSASSSSRLTGSAVGEAGFAASSFSLLRGGSFSSGSRDRSRAFPDTPFSVAL